jgi:hypothetical protein
MDDGEGAGGLDGLRAPSSGTAGWYRDPAPGAGAFARRYYDGERWTEQVSGGAVPAAAPAVPVAPVAPGTAPPGPGAAAATMLPARPGAWTPPPGPLGPPLGPPGRPHRGRKPWFVAGAVVILVALAAAAIVLRGSGSSHPSAWDARVAPIAEQVAKARGLDFDHPVKVSFVEDAEFRKFFEAPDGAPGRKAAARALAQLRAVGLITGDVDLAAATSTEQQSSVLAFYSPEKKQVFVRGEELSPAARVTLAHELTHVLQDQHFDLERLQRRVASDPNGAPDALRALAEGDADRIEEEYRSHLPAADRAAVDHARAADEERASAETADVPFVLQLLFGAPYAYGGSLLGVLTADGGNAGVDRAFGEPTFTQQVFVDPASALERPRERHVPDPRTERGERAVGKVDTLGALDTYLLLAARLDPVTAFDAANGWGAGRMRTVKQGDRTCVRLTVTGRDAAATRTLGAALRAWAAAFPGGAPVVEGTGPIRVLTCDPGPTGGGTSPEPALKTANTILGFHSGFEGSIIAEGVAVDAARCMASDLLRFPDVRAMLAVPDDQLTSEEVQTTVGQHIPTLITTCGAAPGGAD